MASSSSSSSSVKKVNMISQIVRLRQVVQRWKSKSLTRRRIPSGCLAVYVGPSRARFVIPTRFLNLPVFVALLQQAEEEFGFQAAGGLVLPCEPDIFREIVRFLDDDERRFGGMGLEDFFNAISESVSIDHVSDNMNMNMNMMTSSSSSCKEEESWSRAAFTTPLLASCTTQHKTRV